ncbi:type I restriction modification DNA specificity domain protein [Catonella morbi ATCC 51271]|uniref:Type I restriction modification DNA specificity domain protein n=1 Tax=Catonella morbi ATCC 51271 TaxID=592026 RepID=V2Y336_9FIRM|nr:restriction endonuclease subunit S [Catonella morbi]ESL03388.1 type I restriction modification DNA specificity domain protein [Catonella morbi ATCC 51271]
MIVKLEKVCKRIYAGGDVPKDRYSKEKTEDYKVPIFANAEKDEGLYGYTYEAREKELSITVAARGTIGYTVIRREPFFPVVRLITVVPDLEKVSERYLFYALKNCKPQSSGTSIPQLTVPDIKKNTLNLLDIVEQESIADRLDKLNGIIKLRTEEISKLDELIKARFVEMFGDVIRNDKLWKTDSWNNLLRIVNGKNQRAIESNDGEYVICGSGGIMGKARDYLTKENSVIVGRKGNINKPILMREKYWNVDTAFGIEPNNNHICVEYLYMFCLFFDFNRLNKAVTIPSLTKADLLNIEMPVPDLNIQKRFATFVHQVDKSKVAVQKALDETQTLFDSLMQKYFG